MGGGGGRGGGRGCCGGGVFTFEAENECTHISGVKPGYDRFGSIVVFGGKDMGGFEELVNFRDLCDVLGTEGALEDGEEGLVVHSFHDQGGVGLVAVWKGEVVDAYTPFMIVLFKGIDLDPEVEDGSVLGENLSL